MFSAMQGKKLGVLGVILASILGILSPLCMYGTIPIAASFSEKGMRHGWLVAFMMSSVLLNPQLMMYSLALGPAASMIRLVSCTVCGIVAGFLVCLFYERKGSRSFFNFDGFAPGKSHDTDPNLLMRYLKNLGRNIKATGLYFLIGVLLSALFQRYVPSNRFAELFGSLSRNADNQYNFAFARKHNENIIDSFRIVRYNKHRMYARRKYDWFIYLVLMQQKLWESPQEEFNKCANRVRFQGL